MILVSFYVKNNLLLNKTKMTFVNDVTYIVIEFTDLSCCILFGQPCIVEYHTK